MALDAQRSSVVHIEAQVRILPIGFDVVCIEATAYLPALLTSEGVPSENG